MSIFYACIRIFLTLLAGLLHWRAERLSARFVTATKEAEKLAGDELVSKPNENPLAHALRQMRLGAAAVQLKRVEDVALSAQTSMEWVTGWRDWLAGCKGRIAPYVFGVVDVTFLLIMLERWQLTTRTVSRVASFVFTSDPGVSDPTPPDAGP